MSAIQFFLLVDFFECEIQIQLLHVHSIIYVSALQKRVVDGVSINVKYSYT